MALKGHIKTTYTVVCGLCPSEEVIPAAKKNMAGMQAQLHGWINTRDYGWLCSKCGVKIDKLIKRYRIKPNPLIDEQQE